MTKSHDEVQVINLAKPAFEFRYDEEIDLMRPVLHVDYESLNPEERQEFEWRLQQVSAQIPDRIQQFEQDYMHLYETLKATEDDEAFFRINEEMNKVSKKISELNLLYLQIEGTHLHANVDD